MAQCLPAMCRVLPVQKSMNRRPTRPFARMLPGQDARTQHAQAWRLPPGMQDIGVACLHAHGGSWARPACLRDSCAQVGFAHTKGLEEEVADVVRPLEGRGAQYADEAGGPAAVGDVAAYVGRAGGPRVLRAAGVAGGHEEGVRAPHKGLLRLAQLSAAGLLARHGGRRCDADVKFPHLGTISATESPFVTLPPQCATRCQTQGNDKRWSSGM